MSKNDSGIDGIFISYQLSPDKSLVNDAMQFWSRSLFALRHNLRAAL